MMDIDRKRLLKYLAGIKLCYREVADLLREKTDEEILAAPWVLKGLKYTLVEIAEAMANVLQHILAKKFGEPVMGYIETAKQAEAKGLISSRLFNQIKPFFDFRNALIHRYWIISDETLMALWATRKNENGI